MAQVKKPQKLIRSETQIDYRKTINEIQEHLIKAGARKIVFDYDEAELPCAITFSYTTPQGIITFALPVRFNGVDKVLKETGARFRTGKDMQAINTGWRIMKDWILSQLSLVRVEMAELPEVFLPYAVTKDGDTVYDKVKTQGLLQLMQ